MIPTNSKKLSSNDLAILFNINARSACFSVPEGDAGGL
jgi:hypothetical protein